MAGQEAWRMMLTFAPLLAAGFPALRLAAPEWLLLAPLLAFLLWRWRSSRRVALRGFCLLLLLLVLVRPELRTTGRGLDLWVLVDRSASAGSSVEPRLAEWETILERSRKPEDRLFFIDYAAEAVLRDRSAGTALSGDRNETRTALAIRHALSLREPDRASRLLLLGDGFSTEPPDGLEERLRREGVSLDCRLATEGAAKDYRVESLVLPMRAQPGERFLLEIRVRGPGPAKVPFTLARDGVEITRGAVEIPAGGRAGLGVARLTDRVVASGAKYYSVSIAPEEDAHRGNNAAAQWVEIAGGPRLLLASAYPDDPVAAALRAHGFEVDLVTEPHLLNEGRLQGARAVILNNVPAHRLPRPFLEALDFFVRDQAGGLLMTGGRGSFGTGGYFGSPLADLLPVSMELRQEHRKLAVAMAIALDRSGSMGAAVKGGTKMDLANAGTARALELLGPADEVAVFAVDTEPHVVVPLSRMENGAGKLGNTVRRITSGGGGIFVYNALKAAFEALESSPRGQRHVILFADAADAEQPGEYKTLLEKMRAAEMTVSVIGLGTERDSDAAFLKDVAARGGGRIFFTEEAAELPALFEQETVAVARSAFLPEETPLKGLAGWNEIAARVPAWPGAVDGYNLSYLRPGATMAAATADEENAPLVAFWQRGAGRVASVAFPLAGEASARARAWEGYGDFVQTLARWLMGEALLPGIGLKTSIEGTHLSADLLFDETWEEKFALDPPQLVLAGAAAGERREVVWERLEPGRYRASVPLAPGQVVRGAVRAGKASLPFGPLQAGLGAEWAFDPARRAEIAALARASGGMERVDLATVWNAPRRAEFAEIGRWILPVLLGCLLLEALLARLGGRLFESRAGAALAAGAAQISQAAQAQSTWMAKMAGRARRGIAEKSFAEEKPETTKPSPEGIVAPPLAPTEAEAAKQRSERFRRAKRGL